MKKKNGAKAPGVGPALRMVMIAAVTYILLSAMMLVGATPEQHDIQIGAPSAIDILATKDVNDVVTTEAHREAAAAAVEPSYKSVDVTVVGEVSAAMEAEFAELRALREGVSSENAESITDEQLEELNASLSVSVNREQYAALIGASEEDLSKLFSDTASRVREALNSTLPEGQEAAAISRISRALSASGYPAPLVSLTTEVLRDCVRPNMLIDEEITEANRQKARDAVEMETCVKGEVIVRRGDIVTLAQYTMLSSLGLLKEDNLDVPLFAGIALIVFLLMGCLGLYMWRYNRDLLTPKTVMLLGVIMVLVLALSLGVSQWNIYLMPVSLGMMLISLLIGHRLALFVNLLLGFMASMLTDASSGQFTMAMFSVLLMSIVSSPVILAVFSRSMQRMTTLLAGVLVGVSNFVVTLAVGLVNSAELSSVLVNAAWAMASGLLSAVLCIGFQPLMEWLFNLATTARLIELSNPNQPLLRRLLLEAPGTYHHAIIVANLAEAAASAIGANGLLARVGAYYHDVGKLKRPVYFKENQMGDNPHDRTDPRVSAAILTAHPRDGAAMAQKARIPEPVIDIIRQHHGDGVALWFYDKAVKLYGADQVDISAFRYEGPRPQTREAAVVMLADTIEAAARSIPDPDPEKIDATIRKLVYNKLGDGQLDESPLTFRDLECICSAFSTVLTGVFHERIEYPDITPPPRVEHREEAAPGDPARSAADSNAAKPMEDSSPSDAPADEAKPVENAAIRTVVNLEPIIAPRPEEAPAESGQGKEESTPSIRTVINLEPIITPKPADSAVDAGAGDGEAPSSIRTVISLDPIITPRSAETEASADEH